MSPNYFLKGLSENSGLFFVEIAPALLKNSGVTSIAGSCGSFGAVVQAAVPGRRALAPGGVRRWWMLAAILLWAGTLARVHGATNRWENEIAAFEASDRTHFPAPGGVLFVGSSSIRQWRSIEADLPGVTVVRRGVGGCHLADVGSFADRLIVPYQPRLIFVYAGDNDIADGRKAGEVAADFRELSQRLLQALPSARLIFIGIKPCPVRWYAANEVVSANRQIQLFAQRDPRLGFVDVFPSMLGGDGTPRFDLFESDQLH